MMDGKPESFDERFMTDWSLYVLAKGLVDLPSTVHRGESVPVARWTLGAFGAVLHVQWSWSEEEPEDDCLQGEIEVFRREEDAWVPSNGSGGGAWPNPPLEQVAIASDSAEVWGMHCSGGDGWYCCALEGLAGAGARSVEVASHGRAASMPVESPLGYFVAAFDGERPAVVRVLDAAGKALMIERFEGHDLGGEGRWVSSSS
jgi:hypothetical protein